MGLLLPVLEGLLLLEGLLVLLMWQRVLSSTRFPWHSRILESNGRTRPSARLCGPRGPQAMFPSDCLQGPRGTQAGVEGGTQHPPAPVGSLAPEALEALQPLLEVPETAGGPMVEAFPLLEVPQAAG